MKQTHRVKSAKTLIEAVIFDWAGTTVDYGCMAPLYAMQEAFSKLHLTITLDEIRKPMGILKLDHIKTVLEMDRVKEHFKAVHGRAYDNSDVEIIYQDFEKNIFSILSQDTKLIEGILPVQDYLRAHSIKIGSTTGYTKEMIDRVAACGREQGYLPDCIVSADLVKRGRPYPYMLHHNVASLDIQDIRRVVKVGDTLVDILEGLHAGCWSIGVIKGSSLLGLSEKEVLNLEENILQEKMMQVKDEMLSAGAHYVIESIDQLPMLIEENLL